MLDEERKVRQVRLEARAIAEEAEAAVAEKASAERSMSQVLIDLGRLSVPVTIEIANRQFNGLVVHVGSELIRLQTMGGGAYEISTAAIVGIRTGGTSNGPATVTTDHPATVIARLRELASTNERLTVGRAYGPEIIGELVAAGLNQIQVVDHHGAAWFIPLTAITWIGPAVAH